MSDEGCQMADGEKDFRINRLTPRMTRGPPEENNNFGPPPPLWLKVEHQGGSENLFRPLIYTPVSRP
jgi:hypothetical protein